MSRDKYVSREGLKRWLEELLQSPYAESFETRKALELVRDAAARRVPESLQIYCEDVEPVERCRECKNCHEEMPNALWCQGRGLPYQLVPHDGYCDRGKRRDDE